jgi:hypothetical protein
LKQFASQYLELSEATKNQLGVTEALVKLANLNCKEGEFKKSSQMMEKAMKLGYNLKMDQKEKKN